jgi:CTP synthase
VVPHVTNEIKLAIRKLASPDVDVVITELGGTVGDIEGLPFLEAIRQIPLDVGRQNCLFVHLTLVPFLKAAGEAKTKPTQHSVGQLRQIGIQPDVLIVRTERELGRENAEKIALFCNVEKNAVIEEPDKEFSIYEVPLGLVENGLDQLIVDRLGLKAGPIDMSEWQYLLHKVRNPEHEVTIAVVGKYIQHKDAYKSIYESLDHAGIANSARVIVKRVEAEELERGDPQSVLGGVDGILVPGGFGMRGIEGKIDAIRHARKSEVPFFGICLGMQCAVIEFARNVLRLENANSTEFAADTPHPVICLLNDQRVVVDKGGTMRLGSQVCVLDPGSRAAACYSAPQIRERHRHRYEFNPLYREKFARAGLKITGTSPDGGLAEIVELTDHPFFLAVQYHPEFLSKPNRAHPLFVGFIEAALAHQQQQRMLASL